MTPPTGGGSFEKHLIPTGTYPARCVWLLNIGTQEIVWQGTPKKQIKLLIGYELPTELLPSDHPRKGEPSFISERFTFSLNDKGNLRAHINNWRGKALTDDECANFDISKMLGAPGVITVTHVDKDGKTYCNIGSIAPEASMRKLVPDFKVPAQVNESLYFNVQWLATAEGAQYAMTVFGNIPKYYQELIQKSDEWQAYTKQSFYQAPAVAPDSASATPEAPAQAEPQVQPVDDIPLPF